MKNLILPLLFLTGCASAADRPIELRFQPPKEISAAYKDKTGLSGALGYVELYDNVCIVHAPKPRNPTDDARWRILYHELRHCWEGAFHTKTPTAFTDEE